MPVFKTFFKLVKSKLPVCLIYFCIFSAIGIIMANSSSESCDFELQKLRIAIINNDNSLISDSLVKYLEEMHDVKQVPSNDDELINQMFFRELQFTITIPEGFGESFLNNQESLLEYRQVDGSTTSFYVKNQINQYLSSISAYILAGNSVETAILNTEYAINTEDIIEVTGVKQKEDSSYYFFAYMSYILISILIYSMGPVILIFNNKEIHSRNECSSTSSLNRKFQMVLACVIYSLIIWLAFIGLTIIVKMDFNSNYILSLINSFIYLLVTVAIVTLVTSFNLSINGLTGVANVLGLGLSFLGGVFVPLKFLGVGITNFSKFLPTYWYVNALDSIYGNNDKIIIYKSMGVQMLFVITIFAVALVVNKYYRQKRTA